MKINLNESFEHLYGLGEDYSTDEMNNIRPDYIKESREYRDDGTFVITNIDNEENVNEAFSDEKYFYITYSDINSVNSQAVVAATDEENAIDKLLNEYLSDGDDLEIISVEEIDEEEFNGLRSDFNNSPMNNLKVIEESREYKDDGTFTITDIDYNDDTSYEESLNEEIIIPEDFEVAFDEPTPQQLLDPIKLELVQPENNLPIEQNSREEITNSNDVNSSAIAVMAAYQNANKWLDSVKEVLYTDLSCPFFSSFVHNLAHMMPGRFDKFGDILHTINMKVPYPATPEISREPSNITEAFDIIFQVLEQIKLSLNNFIQATDATYHGMACSAEACLNDIESEYPMLYRLRDKWNQCNNDVVDFDKYVCQYVDHKDDLLESLKIKSRELTESYHKSSIPIVKYWLEYNEKNIVYGIDTATNAFDIILDTLEENPDFIKNYDLLNIGIIILDIDSGLKVDEGDWVLWFVPADDEDEMPIGGSWEHAIEILAELLNIDMGTYD